MPTITHLHTHELRDSDMLQVGSSMVSVDSVTPDEMDDVFWIAATCISGNFDQWEKPHRAPLDAIWVVLNASGDEGESA